MTKLKLDLRITDQRVINAIKDYKELNFIGTHIKTVKSIIEEFLKLQEENKKLRSELNKENYRRKIVEMKIRKFQRAV